MGGEKNVMPILPLWMLGSPPHGRGKVDAGIAEIEIVRITPAWAGKSRPRRFWAHRSQDHPRMGGEKIADA